MAINHEMNYYNYGKTLSAEGIMPVLPQNGKQWPEHEYVDLGLPSGTLWATDDIKNESGETLFFSWGETVGNTDQNYFTKENYKFGPITYNGSEEPHEPDWGITKYNQADGKLVLEDKDDAAIANWGPDWCMPTSAQVQELLSYTSQEQLEDGCVFSASNGNDISFALNGEFQAYWWTKDLHYNEDAGDYSCFNACALQCASTGGTVVYPATWRPTGNRIRPVRKK